MAKMQDNVKKSVRDRSRFQTYNSEPSLTKQEFEQQTNINNILKNYKFTGTITMINRKSPLYGDFTSVSDFKTALDRVNEAQQDFLTLPAKVRARFNHNPAELIAFLADKENEKEALELGLIEKKGDTPLRQGLTGLESKDSGLKEPLKEVSQEKK